MIVVRRPDGELEVREAGSRLRPGERRARGTDVMPRLDLPEDHPLRGQRVLKVVPAGWPDCTVGPDGELVPVRVRGDGAVELAPRGDGEEVPRGRITAADGR